jgi:hypothetical protein
VVGLSWDRLAGLFGLSSGKVEPLTRVGFSLIPISHGGLDWVKPYPLTREGLNGLT